MKVEHITLGGNSVIRDTAEILDTTRRVFDVIGYKSQVLHLPKLPFQIKITATEEGAAFDIQKNGDPAVTNLCCFDEKNSSGILQSVQSIADMYKKIGINFKLIDPVTSQWLYSAIVNPFGLNPTEMTIAGEVELYIFEQLYLGYNDRRTT